MPEKDNLASLISQFRFADFKPLPVEEPVSVVTPETLLEDYKEAPRDKTLHEEDMWSILVKIYDQVCSHPRMVDVFYSDLFLENPSVLAQHDAKAEDLAKLMSCVMRLSDSLGPARQMCLEEN